MNTQDRRLHELFAVLAPPRRFELLSLLVQGGDRSVSQLAEQVGLSQSCTTRHLQALETLGLVRGTRDGKRVVFRPHPTDRAAGSVLDSLGGHSPWVPLAETGRPVADARPRRRAAGAGRAPDPAPAAPVQTVIPAPETAPSPPRPESAIHSAPAPAPYRRRDELEDFLL